MDFLHGEQIQEAIKDLVAEKEDLEIAVAYWGKGALKQTGLLERIQKNPDGIKIICDLTSGACNPAPIKRLRKEKVQIRTAEKMHAKVWICGNEVILGSANASANGLGFDTVGEVQGNVEAAIRTGNRAFSKETKDWFRDLWDKSYEITQDELDWATNQWKKRQNSSDRKRLNRKSLHQKLLEGGKLKKFDNVRVLVWRPSNDKWKAQDTRTVQKILDTTPYYNDDERQNKDNRGFYDWWDSGKPTWKFEEGEICLDFTAPPGKRKSIKFNGIYRIVSPSDHFHKINDELKIVLYYIENPSECSGYLFPRADKMKIREQILKQLKISEWEEDRYGTLLDKRLTKLVHGK